MLAWLEVRKLEHKVTSGHAHIHGNAQPWAVDVSVVPASRLVHQSQCTLCEVQGQGPAVFYP